MHAPAPAALLKARSGAVDSAAPDSLRGYEAGLPLTYMVHNVKSKPSPPLAGEDIYPNASTPSTASRAIVATIHTSVRTFGMPAQ